ncbi:Fe-S osidoreductase [Anopheles sinensis]|uniref:Fe-S osidoreductase n=1 Tax=Anopheles sinensis TaxID=74873 RepID=A0A084W739_ANOSI|nr:Fe-S osidoreductase [Anopheles sinensis]
MPHTGSGLRMLHTSSSRVRGALIMAGAISQTGKAVATVGRAGSSHGLTENPADRRLASEWVRAAIEDDEDDDFTIA